MNKTSLLRFLFTTVVVLAAAVLGHALWKRYLYSPWTRDGRVRADVVQIAPDVAGLVATVPVHDNQFVHKGELLMTIDRDRYILALQQAEANLAAAEASARAAGAGAAVAAANNARAGLQQAQASHNQASAGAQQALAAVQQAQVAVDLARLNLQRTEVRAPADGYVTNLDVRVGDYAAAGAARMALIDSHSYYIYGYFEETKLPQLRVGDPV